MNFKSFIHEGGYLCLVVLVTILSAITCLEYGWESLCASSDFSTAREFGIAERCDAFQFLPSSWRCKYLDPFFFHQFLWFGVSLVTFLDHPGFFTLTLLPSWKLVCKTLICLSVYSFTLVCFIFIFIMWSFFLICLQRSLYRNSSDGMWSGPVICEELKSEGLPWLSLKRICL